MLESLKVTSVEPKREELATRREAVRHGRGPCVLRIVRYESPHWSAGSRTDPEAGKRRILVIPGDGESAAIRSESRARSPAAHEKTSLAVRGRDEKSSSIQLTRMDGQKDGRAVLRSRDIGHRKARLGL